MKQAYIKLALTATLFLAAIPISGVAAQEQNTSTTPRAESVKIYEKEIDGDLFCYGSKIEIIAPINGDVICLASESILINAKINGDIRIVSPSVTLGASSEIGLNVLILAQQLDAKTGSKIGRDMISYASEISLASEVGRDTTLAGVNVYLGGAYGRNVHVRADNFTIPIDSEIQGNLDYSARESDMNSGSIAGKVTSTPITDNNSIGINEKSGVGVFGLIYPLSILALGLAFITLRKNYLLETTEKIDPFYVFSTIGLGFLVAFLTPLLAVLLLVSGVATSIGVAILLIWALLLVLAMPTFAFYLARHSLKNINRISNNPVVTMAFGAIFVIIAGFLPGLNIIVKGFGYFLGLGLLVRKFFKKEPQGPLSAEVEHERTIASGKNIAQKLEKAEVENEEGGK